MYFICKVCEHIHVIINLRTCFISYRMARSSSKTLKSQKVTQKRLFKASSKGKYTGTTINPKRRRGEHDRSGKKGKMLYAPTKNMKTTENKLLKKCCKGNKQRKSNAKSKAGYAYTIIPK